MAAGGLAELDVARVQRWCSDQVPEHARGEIRVECDIAPKASDDLRMPTALARGPWTRVDPIPDRALALHQDHRSLTLYWRDRNLKFHRYQFLDPSPWVQDLLDHLDNSGDPIFWG